MTFRDILLYVVLLSGLGRGADFGRWHLRYPTPTSSNLLAVTYAEGLFFAAGEGGVLLSSSNRLDWIRHDTGVTNDLFGFADGDDGLIAVGEQMVLRSADGLVWTPHPQTLSFRAVTYGNGVYAALTGPPGVSNGIMASLDGIRWTAPAQNFTHAHLTGIAYGNGTFVAVDSSILFTSTDGLQWVEGGYGEAAPLYDPSIVYAGDRFVAMGVYYGATSLDGISWQRIEVPGAEYKFSLAYANSVGVYVGRGIVYSSNFTNWTPASIERYHGRPRAVAAGDGQWLVVGEQGAIYVSDDGINWIPSNPGPESSASDLIFGDGKFVLVAGTGDLYVSPDLSKWRQVAADSVYDIAYGQGMFLGVGFNGAMRVSTNGVDWVPLSSPTTTFLWSVAYGSGTFVALGRDLVITSTNGVDWLDTMRTTNRLETVKWLDDKFVLVGRNSTFFESSNGIVWLNRSERIPGVDLEDVAFGRCRYVAISSYEVWTSTNGSSWTRTYSGDRALDNVTYGNGLFVASGFFVTLMSHDGLVWESRLPSAFAAYTAALFANDTFILAATGANGTSIFQSDPLPAPDLGVRLEIENGSQPELSVLTAPGGCCRLEATDALSANSQWQTVTELSFGTNSVLQWTDTSRHGTRFYRGRAVP